MVLIGTKQVYDIFPNIDGMKATEHFLWSELLVNQTEHPTLEILNNLLKIAKLLEKYRAKLFGNNSINITSGWRSVSYNRRIGGASNSYHCKGMALDFTVAKITPQQVQHKLDDIHIGGMEYAPTWTHIDLGNKRRFNP